MYSPIGRLQPKSIKHLTGQLQSLIKGRLWLKILIAMALGIGTGMLLSPSVGLLDKDLAFEIGNWLALPGKIFLALIQMIVVPLVFASVITGLAASEDMEQLRKLGLRVVSYYIITTTIAITIGIGVAMLIQPGKYIDSSFIGASMENQVLSQDANSAEAPTLTQVPDLITNLLPTNPLGSMVNSEMLQVVLFAIIFGLALVSIAPSQSKPLLNLLSSIQEVSMAVVRWAMLLAPFAVFGLLAQITIKVGLDAIFGMAVYVGSVLSGLLILLVFYLLIILLISKKPPWWFLQSVREVQLLAFSTSSSAAVMPLSIKTAEDKLNVKPSIARFLVPLGATINMDGTALYQGVATIFLAQVFDVNLSITSLVLIIVTAVGASIGAPATPGVGIVILAMVLNSVGIPSSGIALIIGVDRILDMSRTALNVTGDLTACLVMDRWIGSSKTMGEQAET